MASIATAIEQSAVAAPAVLFANNILQYPTPSKRSTDDSSSETGSAAKRPRGPRDFVPPDTTGLSKREARLIKNRAAAFLSRQRKREEFETMEARVAELEEENARLRAAAGGLPFAPISVHPLVQDKDTVRLQEQLAESQARLAESRARETELATRLAEVQMRQARSCETPGRHDSDDSASNGDKDEAASTTDGANSPAPSSSGALPLLADNVTGPASRSSTALGMLVLLCALPSLLAPTSSAPKPGLIDAFPFSGLPVPRALDTVNDLNSWTNTEFDLDLEQERDNSGMDVDGTFSFGGLSFSGLGLDASAITASPSEVSATDGNDGEWTRVVLEGSGALEIAFDARKGKDGSVRVRMSPSSSSLPSSALGLSSLPDSPLPSSSLASPSTSGAYADVLTHARDPFLGVGAVEDVMSVDDVSWLSGLPSLSAGSPSIAGTGERKRVRIALARAPDAESGEGGEWVVELR